MLLPETKHITLRSENSKLFLNFSPSGSAIMLVNLKMPLAVVTSFYVILKTSLMASTHAVRNNSPLCNKQYTHCPIHSYSIFPL